MDEVNGINTASAVGPGLTEERQPAGHSKIEGFDDSMYVEILNPMTVDFVGQVAVTKPMNANMRIGGADDPNSPNMTKNEGDVRNTYGFDLRSNAQSQGKIHVRTRVPIAAGQTMKVFGSEAQVLVMQLVTAILQQEGHSNIADPALREATEERVIRSHGNLREQMMSTPQSERAQLQQALDQMNDVPQTEAQGVATSEEVEFPDAQLGLGAQSSSGGAEDGPTLTAYGKRVGRPPKSA